MKCIYIHKSFTQHALVLLLMEIYFIFNLSPIYSRHIIINELVVYDIIYRMKQ